MPIPPLALASPFRTIEPPKILPLPHISQTLLIIYLQKNYIIRVKSAKEKANIIACGMKSNIVLIIFIPHMGKFENKKAET
jgi:hypothetical protein